MTSLWPWGVVRRHMTFQENLRKRWSFLLKEYEKGGGKYHGKDKNSATVESDKGSETEYPDSDLEFV